jgi:hypothetical protein
MRAFFGAQLTVLFPGQSGPKAGGGLYFQSKSTKSLVVFYYEAVQHRRGRGFAVLVDMLIAETSVLPEAPRMDNGLDDSIDFIAQAWPSMSSHRSSSGQARYWPDVALDEACSAMMSRFNNGIG